jgi:DNA-binding cell septation regulator SpoVG
MHFLASYYNMTVYHCKLPHLAEGRDYMFEINPRYVESTQDDRLNVIDARWIDTETGLFIDITTVRIDDSRVFDGVEGALMVKDRHHYLVCHHYVSATQQRLTCTAGAGERSLPLARVSL